MRSRFAEAIVWCVAILLLMMAVYRWRDGTPVAAASGALARPTPPSPAALDLAALARAAEAVRRGNPFRLDRRPSAIAFEADPLAHLPRAEQVLRPPHPGIRLVGITGPPWRGVLEGVPGREGGVLVRPGDALGELLIRRITSDTVVVEGADTTWRLTVRRAWQ